MPRIKKSFQDVLRCNVGDELVELVDEYEALTRPVLPPLVNRLCVERLVKGTTPFRPGDLLAGSRRETSGRCAEQCPSQHGLTGPG